MAKAPGSDGVAGELKALQRRIAELERRGNNDPVCITRLSNAWNLAAFENWRPVTSWKPTSEIDTHGMFHYNEGGDTWWEIPVRGWYSIKFHSVWAVASNTESNYLSSQILKNGYGYGEAIAEVIFSQAPRHAAAYDVISDDLFWEAGDRIRMNFFSELACRHRFANNHTKAFAGITIRYEGSE